MLPITKYQSEIVSSVNETPVTIINAETGSGKSTQLCQYLSDAGYDVIVTEPRRIAAVTLADRVSEEIGDFSIVGYHTGFEKDIPENSKILFCTDGVQLVKQLTERKPIGGTRNPRVLVIDEAHEWNLNIESLVGWTRKRLNEGWNNKVVIASATLDHDELSRYYGNAKVLNIPGTLFPVTVIEHPADEFCDQIRKYVAMGKNVLAFLPGKREIEETMNEIYGINAMILPMHGELTMAENKRCFQNYNLPKVVLATNIAQTSVTIPDIDVVVDTGTERRVETNNGIQGIFLNDISVADCMQRKGRAGRTKDGIYVLCGTPLLYRPDYSQPEIKRLMLDQMVLRLTSVGIDASEMEFFHQPDVESIIAAKNTLQAIVAIKDGIITEIGNKILQIPISVKYARMIIEADKYGVVDDVITIAAILEIGSLVNHREARYNMFTDEDESDLLAELSIWNKYQGRKIDFKKEGLFAKNFFRVKELREKIIQSIENNNTVTLGTTGDRNAILRSCFMGMVNNVYFNDYGDLKNGKTRDTFHFDNKSCVNTCRSKWYTGFPITIEYKGRYGKNQIDIMKSLTLIDRSWVEECMPEMFNTRVGEFQYDSYSECVVGETVKTFGNVTISREDVKYPDHPDYEKLKAEYEERRKSIYGWDDYVRPKAPDRQETVDIEGKEYKIDYSSSWYAGRSHIDLTLEDLKEIKETINVKLDNGNYPEFRYLSLRAQTIPLLIDSISRWSVKYQMESLLNRLPKHSSAKYNVVMDEFIPCIGAREITDPFGNVTNVYVCLALDGKTINVVTSKDEDEANSFTEEAIKFIFDMAVSSKYPVKKFQFKINGKMTLTNKGNNVYLKFLEFVNECKSEVDKCNIQAYIEMVDEYFNEIIKELDS